jgi:purine nucleosidase
MLIHLDTDFGGDPDDACALAFLLASPVAEVIGITTNLDNGAYRAACVRHYLDLTGQSYIPVANGAAVTLTDQKQYDSTATDSDFWPRPIIPTPTAPGAALDLLMSSIERGATIVAIGAATNLALLELTRPGVLARTMLC